MEYLKFAIFMEFENPNNALKFEEMCNLLFGEYYIVMCCNYYTKFETYFYVFKKNPSYEDF